MFARPRDWTTLLPLKKLFLPSIFNSVDFRSSMSCILLEYELANKNVIKKCGVLIDDKDQEYSFRPPKSTNPQSKRFGAQETCSEMGEKWTFVLQ